MVATMHNMYFSPSLTNHLTFNLKLYTSGLGYKLEIKDANHGYMAVGSTALTSQNTTNLLFHLLLLLY